MNNDLISRSELINDLEIYFKSGVEGIDPTTLFKQILLDIKNAPTVELFCSYLSDGEVKQPCIEAPCDHERPHGKWEIVEEPFGWDIISCGECSNCKHSWTLDEYSIEELKDDFKFCPNCGAIMNGGRQ